MASQINPIVVDLDGTLIKTDMLFESANQFITQNPLRFWQPFVWLMRGRPYLKEQLAQRYEFDAANLPYNEQVLTWLREQATKGVPIYLATASNRVIADAVAQRVARHPEHPRRLADVGAGLLQRLPDDLLALVDPPQMLAHGPIDGCRAVRRQTVDVTALRGDGAAIGLDRRNGPVPLGQQLGEFQPETLHEIPAVGGIGTRLTCDERRPLRAKRGFARLMAAPQTIGDRANEDEQAESARNRQYLLAPRLEVERPGSRASAQQHLTRLPQARPA